MFEEENRVINRIADEVQELFYACVPIRKFTEVLHQEFVSRNENDIYYLQEEILNKTINDPLIKEYPIKASYQMAFLKGLMNLVENYGSLIHEEIHVSYYNLMSVLDKSTHYRHFLIKKGLLPYVTLEESTCLISQGTTGLCTWQGAVHLAKWCEINSDMFIGKKVLELGCGLGFAGLSIIVKSMPKRYIFSDCHETVLDMLCKNIKLNLSTSEKITHSWPLSNNLHLFIKFGNTNIKVIELKWEDICKFDKEDNLASDIILGADILYDSDSFPVLLTALTSLLTSDNCAIFAATVRNLDTLTLFLSQLGKYGLTYTECISPEECIQIELNRMPVKILKISKANLQENTS